MPHLDAPERLAVLRAAQILDTPPEPAFDRLARLAARIVAAPIAAVSFVDEASHFVKSAVGLAPDADPLLGEPLVLELCQRVVREQHPLAVEDTTSDPALAGGPRAAGGAPGLVAYLGVPLLLDGQVLGVVCVMDRVPRRWSSQDVISLCELAVGVETEVELRRAIARLDASERAVREREAHLLRLADVAFEGIAVTRDGVILEGNEALARMFGYLAHELAGRDMLSLVHPSDRARVAVLHGAGSDARYETTGMRRDGTAFPVEVRGRTVPWRGGEVRVKAMVDLTEREAAAQVARLHGEILSNLSEGVCLVRISDGAIVYANPAFTAMFGYADGELHGRCAAMLVPPREVGALRELARAIAPAGRAIRELENVRKDGARLWCRATLSSMVHPEHGAVWIVALADLTERKREAEALARQTAFVELVRAVASEANAATTSAAAMHACLARACEHLGWPLGHVYLTVAGPGGRFAAPSGLWYVRPPDRHAAFRELTAASRFAPGVGLPGRVLATGTAHWVEDVTEDPSFARGAVARASQLRAAFAVPVLVGDEVAAVLELYSERREPPDPPLLAVMTDVGRQLGRVVERERARAAIERHAAEVQALSLVDELTGLRNRRGFHELAAHQLGIAERGGRSALLVFADLDGLKQINDTLGHEAGDAAIRALGRVLRAVFRDTDVIARLGGDEFVVLAADADAAAAADLRARLAEALAAHAAAGCAPCPLAVSVGIAVYDPRAPRSLEELIAEADAQMYAHKGRCGRRRPTTLAIPVIADG